MPGSKADPPYITTIYFMQLGAEDGPDCRVERPMSKLLSPTAESGDSRV